MKTKPLASIIILSYKNYHYIYEALNSVISQDYPNIEIIISNDGSNDFNKKAIEQYFKKNKKNNIKNIVINNNPVNLGTVKNINTAIKLSKGKYLIIFAADDVMSNNNVVTKLVSAFDKLSEKELIVTSQIGMYDLKLKRLIQLFISEKNKEKIIKLSPKKLFAEMTIQCILPGSGTCYKREIFKKYGYFDEKYVLVEDYSSALKLSRLGVKYNFLDFISFKHRDGGISHGNVNGEIHKSKQYDLDILNILEKESMPYIDLMNEKQKHNFLKRYKDLKFTFKFKYFYRNGTRYERIQFVRKYWKNLLSSFSQEIYREIIAQLEGKKFKLFLFGILVYLFSIFLKNPNISPILKYFGLFLIISSTLMIILNFIKKYLFRIITFFKSLI